MVYIYLPAAYYHLKLDATNDNLLTAGFSAVPAVFLVVFHFALPPSPVFRVFNFLQLSLHYM